MTEVKSEITDVRVIRCLTCRTPLSRPLIRFSGSRINEEDGEPAITSGTYALSTEVLEPDEAYWGMNGNEVIVNLSDLQNLEPCGSRVGCCGPAGDEPNLKCFCGRVVGTEVGDCYQPHFVHLPLSRVELVPRK